MAPKCFSRWAQRQHRRGTAEPVLVSAEGGTPQQLAASVLQHGSWKWVAEHPDGRLSAAGTHETLGKGFFTFSRSGEHVIKSNTSAVPSLPSPSTYERFRFTWTRTGTRLYVEATVKVDNLWRIDVDPGTLEWRGAERLTTGGGSDIDAVVSADESRIAYVQQIASMRLWAFPLDAADGRLKGEGQPFSEDGAAVGAADLSPTGPLPSISCCARGPNGRKCGCTGSTPEPRSSSSLTGSTRGGRGWAKHRRFQVAKDAQSALMLREPDGTERQLSPWSQTRSLLPTQALPGTQSSSWAPLRRKPRRSGSGAWRS